MAKIEIDGISGQEATHEARKLYPANDDMLQQARNIRAKKDRFRMKTT
ncbi:MAG: hypothetical protein PHD01_06170 [Geobacteraceae bacterium]|nr:hypothetical protein [Geobacteraceae bacterium]